MTDKKHLEAQKAPARRNKLSGGYRLDPYGRTIKRDSYTKYSADGWELDRVKPKSQGGMDHTRHLKRMHWATNLDKASGLAAPKRPAKRIR